MALLQCDFRSEVLGLDTQMNVLLPEKNRTTGKKYPVLYLLHGLSDDHKSWQRRTAIERYLQDKELIVIMPNVHRSFYTDMAVGYPYWTFISQEVPSFSEAFFPISTHRQDTFVAGLSMGGFGAFKLALNLPEKFSKAASLSGALDMIDRIKRREQAIKEGQSTLEDVDVFYQYEMSNIFGSYKDMKESSNNLFEVILKQLKAGKKMPDLFQCCGTDDFLYGGNIAFRDFALNHHLNLEYTEGLGTHTWDYWDKMIQKVLNWLPV